MLVFLDDVLVDILPYPVAPDQFEIIYHPKGQTFALYADGTVVESGVTWFSYTKNVDIEPKTGRVHTKTARIAKIRAVFAGKHLEGEFQL